MAEPGRILITGASGFLGREVCRRLAGAHLRMLSRRPGGEPWIGGDLTDPGSLRGCCEGVEAIVHLASSPGDGPGGGEWGRSHHRVSVEGTEALLEEARRAGVRRVLFVSSVRVLGESTPPGVALPEEAEPAPVSDYARAKAEAERRVLTSDGPEGCVLRLPMLYGDAPRGHLVLLAALMARPWVPRLPDRGNRRSMLHLEDAADAVALLLERWPGRGIYHATDGVAPTVEEVCRLLAQRQGVPAAGWRVPERLLRLAGRFGDALGATTGRRPPIDTARVRSLLDWAWYDDRLLRERCGFRPRRTLGDSLGWLRE